MARVYKNHINAYSGLQEFQEKAVRFLNELYGREKTLDFIDFAVDEENQMYIATGWFDGEDAPVEQKVGEPLSPAALDAIASPVEEPAAPAQDKAKPDGKKRK